MSPNPWRRCGDGARGILALLVLLDCTPSRPVLAQRDAPVAIVAPLLRALRMQAELGVQGPKDSIMIDLADVPGISATQVVQIGRDADVLVRHDIDRPCSRGVDSDGASARASCAVKEYPVYVEISNAIYVDSAVEARVMVARRLPTSRRKHGAFGAIAAGAKRVMGRSPAQRTTLAMATYRATLVEGTDGTWRLLQLVAAMEPPIGLPEKPPGTRPRMTVPGPPNAD